MSNVFVSKGAEGTVVLRHTDLRVPLDVLRESLICSDLFVGRNVAIRCVRLEFGWQCDEEEEREKH